MTKDRQKLSVFVVLLAVLGLTIVLGYRMNRPQTTAAVQTPAPKTSTNPPAPNDTRIRLDLLENSGSEDIGKKNVFQYQQAPPPPPPPTVTPKPGPSSPPPFQSSVPSTTPPRPGPTPPPPPPPINLKYQGLFAVNAGGDKLTAVLADDSRHYNVTTGEVLLGRYRILSISEKAVEVEDLQNNRNQTLPLLK